MKLPTLPTLPQWLKLAATTFAGAALAYGEQNLAEIVVNWRVVEVGAVIAGLAAVVHMYQQTPEHARMAKPKFPEG